MVAITGRQRTEPVHKGEFGYGDEWTRVALDDRVRGDAATSFGVRTR